MPELRDVNSDQQDQGLATNLVIDRDTASRLGITRRNDRRGALRRFRPARSLDHVHGAEPVFRGDGGGSAISAAVPDAFNGIFIKSSTGAMVPLSTIAHYENQRTSLAVNHQGQYPAVTLTFNLAPNVALGDAVTALEKVQREMGMPSTIHASFQGTAQAFQDSLKNEPYLILAALVAVYIVLGILYESLIHPLTILSTLPPAGAGAILALLITGTDLSIIALIGIILLIGIVKKNAIMMIDFALQAEREQGLPPVEAIYQACLLRFRPIMMTTMAATLRRYAAGHRHGRRLRAAQAAGHHHRRRAAGFAGAHALYHAGGLSVLRQVAVESDEAAKGRRRSWMRLRETEEEGPLQAGDSSQLLHRQTWLRETDSLFPAD